MILEYVSSNNPTAKLVKGFVYKKAGTMDIIEEGSDEDDDEDEQNEDQDVFDKMME